MFELIGDLLGGAASVATGGLFGAAVRLLPALFTGIGKMFTEKADREQEYRMALLQRDIAKDGGEQRLREIDHAGQADALSKQMDAWKMALESQGRPTGVAWVDALSAAVRPITTYYFLVLYAGIKVSLAAWPQLAPVWNTLWSPADTQMFFGILGFWFVDRQLGKSAVGK